MCAVSAVMPAIQQQWPSIQTLPYQDLTAIQEVLRRLDVLDRKLGAKECPADAPKVEYLKQLEARIIELERQTGIGSTK